MMCSITAILVRNRGLGTARFAELAAGAGVRAYGVPSHAGGLPTNTGERWGGEKWTNAGIRPIRGWANRRLGVFPSVKRAQARAEFIRNKPEPKHTGIRKARAFRE